MIYEQIIKQLREKKTMPVTFLSVAIKKGYYETKIAVQDLIDRDILEVVKKGKNNYVQIKENSKEAIKKLMETIE